MQIARRAMTLIEILVVIGIIALLAAILLPAITGLRNNSYRVETQQWISEVSGGLEGYKLNKGVYPAPDLPDDPAKSLEGYLASLPDESGVLDVLDRGQFIGFDHSRLDEEGRFCDPWGAPIRYVRGNNANRDHADPDRPRDTNKPVAADRPAAESDWNVDDVGGYPYIWSQAGSDDPAAWIYLRNSEATSD